MIKEKITFFDKSLCFTGLHKKLNTFLKGRSLLSLEKALALLIIFLSNHNEKLTGKRYIEDVMSYFQANAFSLRDLENYGLILKEEKSKASVEPETFPDKVVTDISEKLFALCSIKDQIASEDDLVNPCEILCNSEFLGIPQNCNNSCNEKLSVLEMNLSRIGRALKTGLTFDNVVDFIHSLTSREMASHHSSSDTFQKIKAVLMENRQSLGNVYKGKKKIKLFLTNMQIADNDPDFVNLSLIAAAIILRSVVLIVSCTSSPCIQTIIPRGRLTKFDPIVVGYSLHSKSFFDTEKKVLVVNGPEGSMKKSLNESDPLCQCTCGRSHRAKGSSCTDDKCPCYRKQQSCTKGSCFNCENKFGKSLVPTPKSKSCKCGGSNHMTKDICKKLRCTCFKNHWSCETDPVCSCKNCENDFGRKERNSLKRKPQSGGFKRRECKSAGKMPHFGKEKDFYDHVGLKKKQSIWTEEETLAVFECHRAVKNSFGSNMSKITGLYNQLSQQFRGMALRKKNKSQIESKLQNLASYNGMLNK